MSLRSQPASLDFDYLTKSGFKSISFIMMLSALVILLMMAAGLVMRLNQAQIITIDLALFYQILTAHGAGMVGIAGLSGAGIMWFFLNRHVSLSVPILLIFLGLFLLGVVLILVAIFIGQFGAAWTFLYPLPAVSGGAWGTWAAASFVLGLTSIGVGFLLLYLNVGIALINRYGSLGRALGWPLVFGGQQDDVPPPTVVASAAVTVFNTIGIVVGAAVLVATLANLFFPELKTDPLLAKNMIFFFGHVFINASIYMAVIAVYEIIPLYTGRPWKTSRLFALAWTMVLLMVMAVYPHHLLQDTVMPNWTLVMGQIISYLSGIPIIAVTAFSLLTYIYRSNMKWDLASGLLVLSVFGWAGGSVPAIIDGTITVNKVMHNTMWVPGHFHFYLILGMIAMVFGFMAWLRLEERGHVSSGLSPIVGWAYAIGGLGVVFTFLISGALSVPRRFAVHWEAWTTPSVYASVFAGLLILAVALFLIQFLRDAPGWRQS